MVQDLAPIAEEVGNERLGIPIIVWGQELPQTTQHTFDAITGSDMSGFKDGIGKASSLLEHVPRQPSTWLKILPPISGLVRDEYPYATSIPGGEQYYLDHQVSVRYVANYEQSSLKGNSRATNPNYVAPQMLKLGYFYAPHGANVPVNSGILSLFGVLVTYKQSSYFINRGGNIGKFPYP